MAAPVRTPRARWVEQGLIALAEGGPDSVSVERLAASLEVTKGGFYHHFSGRAELLEALLDTWEHNLVDQVIDQVEAGGGDPAAKLHRLLATGSTLGDLMDVELAIREWSRRDPAVAERLARVDDRRMDYLRSLFGALTPDRDEVEARCLLTLTLFVGNRFVAASHGRRRRRQVTAAALTLLESGLSRPELPLGPPAGSSTP